MAEKTKNPDVAPLDEAPVVATPAPNYEVVGIPKGEVYVMELHKTFHLGKLTAAELKELVDINYAHIVLPKA